jgi:hypothetical protein
MESGMGIYDHRKALIDLLNLPPLEKGFYGSDGKDLAVDAFISLYGDLRRMPELETFLDNYVKRLKTRRPVRTASALFQGMITTLLKGDLFFANGGLAIIFSQAEIGGKPVPPGLNPDILAGTLEPAPRDLLDAIAVEFMRSHRKIGLCLRCNKFFFIIERGKYCSINCGELTKRERSSASMKQLRQRRKKESRRGKDRRT